MIVAHYACTHCGRTMKRASANGMGPKCALAVLGARPARRGRVLVRQQDPRQMALGLEQRA